jgi:CheY-like chemotaxis protein
MLDVVIVDDAKEDALLAQRVLLNECKIRNPILICTNGKDAIGLCEEFHRSGRPALFLVDLIMSPVSGLEVLRFWGASPYRKSSVVVMVSGLNDLKAINEGYQLGARTFILKPVTREDMVTVMNSLGDQIVIHQEPEGYTLHWASSAAEGDADKMRRGPRVITLSA